MTQSSSGESQRKTLRLKNFSFPDPSATESRRTAVGSRATGEVETPASPRERLQETFLTALRRRRVPVRVYLTNGVKLSGLVDDHDSFTVLVVQSDIPQLIYKHAIATISPIHPVDLRSS